MGLFRRKEVPEELPNLAVDEISKKVASFQPEKNESKYKPLPKPEIVQKINSTLGKSDATSDEHGYFKDLIKNVTEEASDIEKLDSWYKSTFLNNDIVFQMREYWEKQQPEVMLKNVSGELKIKLMEKTQQLHKLEKEWQDAYFNLLAKEDEIRKEEKELKGSMAELIQAYKNSFKKNKK